MKRIVTIAIAIMVVCLSAFAGNPNAYQPDIDHIDLDAMLEEMDRAEQIKLDPKIMTETYYDEFGGVFMSSVDVLDGVKEAMDDSLNGETAKKEHVVVQVAKAPFRIAGAIVSGIVETTAKAIDSSFRAMKDHPKTAGLGLLTAWLVYDNNKSHDDGGNVVVTQTPTTTSTVKQAQPATGGTTITVAGNTAPVTVILGDSNQDSETSGP